MALGLKTLFAGSSNQQDGRKAGKGMRLYYFETPNPRKPCAVAKYVNSPVEYIRVDLTQGENQTKDYLKINPNGKVPSLTDGKVSLWEGHSIMIYLAHKAKSDLWPKDPIQQIDVMRWLNWDTAHFSRHAGALLFNNFIRARLGDGGGPDPDAVAEATEFFLRFAGVLDNHLKSNKYLVDNRLTVADFGVASILPNAEEAKLPLDGFSNIVKWHDRLMELPAWRNPFPE